MVGHKESAKVSPQKFLEFLTPREGQRDFFLCALDSGTLYYPHPPLAKQRLCPSNTRHWFRQFLHC